MIESIFLYPLEGTFDVAPIEEFLTQRPDVIIDPLGTGTYLVCGSPDSVEFMRDERLANPSQFPYVILVTLGASCINIFQEYGNSLRLRSARTIVEWLLGRTRCRIEDGYQNDWTERVAGQGVDVLYPQLA